MHERANNTDKVLDDVKMQIVSRFRRILGRDVISREVGGVSMCSHSQRVLPYINHIGMYRPPRVGVCAVLVLKWVLIFPIFNPSISD